MLMPLFQFVIDVSIQLISVLNLHRTSLHQTNYNLSLAQLNSEEINLLDNI
jgi:hypothetical protein